MDAAARSPWAPLAELMAVVAGTGPAAREVPPLLADEAPDSGLFGPGSVTWRLAREPFLLVGGGRALLMQVANPLVAQGVVDHSGYEEDPFGRLVRTVRWLVAVTFGTNAEARQASRTVMGVHDAVRGALAPHNAAPGMPAGTAYSASDARLSRWVLATILDSMLATYTAMVGPLSGDDADTFVREWRDAARLVGVSAANTWPTAGDLRDYVDAELRTRIPSRPRATPHAWCCARPCPRRHCAPPRPGLRSSPPGCCRPSCAARTGCAGRPRTPRPIAPPAPRCARCTGCCRAACASLRCTTRR